MYHIFTSSHLSFSFFFFFLEPHLRHMEVPGPGIEPMPQQQLKSQKWECPILNLLSHQGTPFHSFFYVTIQLSGQWFALNLSAFMDLRKVIDLQFFFQVCLVVSTEVLAFNLSLSLFFFFLFFFFFCLFAFSRAAPMAYGVPKLRV